MTRKREWGLLPDGLEHSAREYIENGQPVGSFLEAVISNDLKESFGKADLINRHRMFDIVSFFYNYCPLAAQGSPEKYAAWVALGGLAGEKIQREEKGSWCSTCEGHVKPITNERWHHENGEELLEEADPEKLTCPDCGAWI